MGFEPVISRYLCDALTNWAMKLLTLRAGHLWVLRSPWGMNVEVIIWNISYIELQMWNQVSYDPCSYERNSCNWVYRSLKKLRLQRGLNLWPCDIGVRLKPNELWSHWRWELEINHILIWISLLKMSYTFHPQLRICILHYFALRYEVSHAHDVNGVFFLTVLLTLL